MYVVGMYACLYVHSLFLVCDSVYCVRSGKGPWILGHMASELNWWLEPLEASVLNPTCSLDGHLCSKSQNLQKGVGNQTQR